MPFLFWVKWVYHKLYIIFQFQIFYTNWPSLLDNVIYSSYKLAINFVFSSHIQYENITKWVYEYVREETKYKLQFLQTSSESKCFLKEDFYISFGTLQGEIIKKIRYAYTKQKSMQQKESCTVLYTMKTPPLDSALYVERVCTVSDHFCILSRASLAERGIVVRHTWGPSPSNLEVGTMLRAKGYIKNIQYRWKVSSFW